MSTINVRLVEDHAALRYWFEEELKGGEWVKIPETDMACEGNARSALLDVLETRRQHRLSVLRTYSATETIKLP